MVVPDRRYRLHFDGHQFSRHHHKNASSRDDAHADAVVCLDRFFHYGARSWAFPVLTAALAMLTLDRYLGMHFFSNTFGGNMMMYANLFWTWGHPEVYILILPAFGIFSEVVATFSGKRLFGYGSMVYATAVITILSFFRLGASFFHHGCQRERQHLFRDCDHGDCRTHRVKTFNWLFTMYRGRIRFATPMYWALGFLVTFAIGGAAGVLLSIPPADYVLHNSLFLIGHFHNVIIPGALFGFFAGYYYWFPKAVGFRLDEDWANAHSGVG